MQPNSCMSSPQIRLGFTPRSVGRPLAELRRIVAHVDSEQVVFGLETMEAMLGRSVTAERF